jgi:hypothetical protein
MLAAALLVTALALAGSQPVQRTIPARAPGTVPSGSLAKRFATLFPIGDAPRAGAPRRPLTTHETPLDPRRLQNQRQEIICGLTVVRQSPDVDGGILLRGDHGVGLPVRRVESDACRPGDPGRK